MYTFAALLVAAVSGSSVPPPQLIYNESFTYAYMGDTSLSKGSDGRPYFQLGTSLNKPHLLEVHGPTGKLLWSKTDNRSGAAFSASTARHTEAQPVGGHVDLVVCTHYWNGPSPDFPGCSVQGYSMASGPTPVWTFNTPGQALCALTSLEMSDDGSSVALSASIASGNGLAPGLWLLDGQTGAIKWAQGGNDTSAGAGPLSISAKGSYLCHSYQSGQSYKVSVLLSSGELRFSAFEGWNTPGQISDSGDYLVLPGQDMVSFLKWDAATSTYSPAFPIFRPTNGNDWAPDNMALSSDATGGADNAELVSVAWMRFDGKQARVTTHSLATGKLLGDVTTPLNTAYGNSARVAMDGVYTGVALQGDNDNSPTVWLLQAGVAEPLFSYTTRGSMEAVDVVLDASAGKLWLTVAGKACNDNVPCMGSDALVWEFAV